MTIPNYTTEGTAVPDRRRWPFDADPLREFNLRSIGMLGPYGAAVGFSCAALTAGAALTYQHQPNVDPHSPTAEVRLANAGTASLMSLPPVEVIDENFPVASGAPGDDTENPTFTFKK